MQVQTFGTESSDIQIFKRLTINISGVPGLCSQVRRQDFLPGGAKNWITYYANIYVTYISSFQKICKYENSHLNKRFQDKKKT